MKPLCLNTILIKMKDFCCYKSFFDFFHDICHFKMEGCFFQRILHGIITCSFIIHDVRSCLDFSCACLLLLWVCWNHIVQIWWHWKYFFNLCAYIMLTLKIPILLEIVLGYLLSLVVGLLYSGIVTPLSQMLFDSIMWHWFYWEPLHTPEI